MFTSSLICSLVTIVAFAKNADARVFELCNYSTSGRVEIAYMFFDGNDWWVQGWRHIEQGNCSRFHHDGGSFHYYGRSPDGSEWSGDVRGCVLRREFKLLRDHNCDEGRWEYFVRKSGLGDFYRVRLTD